MNFAQGRIAFLLEGGYDLAGLRNSAAAVLAELQDAAGSGAERPRVTESGVEPIIRRVLQVHEKYH
jgi:acetoin utilization deacetylase AcuC-like enzyme